MSQLTNKLHKIPFYQQLQSYIDKGLVKVQKHSDANLFIYNYTPQCQFERSWDEVTIACRGLILDGEGHIVARPFAKFFNVEELAAIPKDPYTIYPKLDGSLGILYWDHEGKPCIASRGSFHSEQAIKGTQMLRDTGIDRLNLLNKNHTQLFEIIYPENRIVVDYGKNSHLVHLATIDKETGKDVDDKVAATIFRSVYSSHSLADTLSKHSLVDLKRMNTPNAEGFVIQFNESGLRAKIKFEEYLRIHKLVTECSSYSIWELMQAGKSINEVLDRVPDEFYAWVKAKQTEILQQYNYIERTCREAFTSRPATEDRKELAEYFNKFNYSSILFKMLDSRDYVGIIWKAVKPIYERPFSGNTEEEI